MAERTSLNAHHLVEQCWRTLEASEPFLTASDRHVLLLRYEILSLQQELKLLVQDEHKRAPARADDPSSGQLSVALNHNEVVLREIAAHIARDQASENDWTTLTEKARTARLQLQAAHKAARAAKLGGAAAVVDVTITTTEAKSMASIFALSPFHIQPQQISANISTSALAQALSESDNSYMGTTIQAARKWVQPFLMSSGSLLGLRELEEDLVTRIWSSMETLRTVNLGWTTEQAADKKEFFLAVDQLDQGLRDALYRHHSSKLSLVLLGSEGCGKSTFLNAFIGQNILPTGGQLIIS